MGIQKCSLQLYADFFNSGLFDKINSVIEIGSQELQASREDVLLFLTSIGKESKEKEIPELSTLPSTKIIYDWLEVKDYEIKGWEKKFATFKEMFN